METKLKLTVQASEATKKYRVKLTVTAGDIALETALSTDQIEEAYLSLKELKEKGYTEK